MLMAGNNIVDGFPKRQRPAVAAAASTHRCIRGKDIETGQRKLNATGRKIRAMIQTFSKAGTHTYFVTRRLLSACCIRAAISARENGYCVTKHA